MKCPVCLQMGEKSKVFSRWSSSTCMGSQKYWDEDGNLHIHDPNRTTAQYSCSNGHIWNVDSWHGCPSCQMNHKESLITVIKPEGFELKEKVNE